MKSPDLHERTLNSSWCIHVFVYQEQKRRSSRTSGRCTAPLPWTFTCRLWYSLPGSSSLSTSCCLRWRPEGTRCSSSPKWCAAWTSWKTTSFREGNSDRICYSQLITTHWSVSWNVHFTFSLWLLKKLFTMQNLVSVTEWEESSWWRWWTLNSLLKSTLYRLRLCQITSSHLVSLVWFCLSAVSWAP